MGRIHHLRIGQALRPVSSDSPNAIPLPGKLLELAGLLGHESLDTTAIYTRPSRDDLAADLERSHLNVDG